MSNDEEQIIYGYKSIYYSDNNTEISKQTSIKRDLTDKELNEILEEIEDAGSISTDDFPLKNIREKVALEA
jgi:hypothetical protein